MEPEGSLQRSQALKTCPYPEPDQSSPSSPSIPVYQDPLYNTRLHFNWLTFLYILLCTWIASSILCSVTLM
jgi:hypothetical protein